MVSLMSFVTVLLNTNTQTPRHTTMQSKSCCILSNLKQSSPAIMPSLFHAVVYNLVSRLYMYIKKKRNKLLSTVLANTLYPYSFAATLSIECKPLDIVARSLALFLPRLRFVLLFTLTIQREIILLLPQVCFQQKKNPANLCISSATHLPQSRALVLQSYRNNILSSRNKMRMMIRKTNEWD